MRRLLGPNLALWFQTMKHEKKKKKKNGSNLLLQTFTVHLSNTTKTFWTPKVPKQ